jgi:hypothetical protein
MSHKRKIFIFLIILFLINGCNSEVDYTRSYFDPVNNKLIVAPNRCMSDTLSIIAEQLAIMNAQLVQLLKQKAQ